MLRAAAFALLLAAPVLAQHNVWVVAKQAGPGVDFTNPWSAVLAAASGDTILVKAGDYSPSLPFATSLALPAKTLSITADAGAIVELGATALHNLPEGYLLTLSHINFTSSVADEAGLALEDNAGAVWLDHCNLKGFVGVPQMQLNPSSALKVVDCSSVVVTHSQLGGAAGLQAQSSNVYAFRSTITGGTAKCMPNWSPQCTDGGAGVWAKGGLTALQSCLVQGGAPNAAPQCFDGMSFPFLCSCWSFGGPALHLESGAQVEAYDAQLASGATAPPCGFTGSILDIVSGQLVDTAGPGFEITGSSPLRVGQSSSLEVTGQPGDAAWAVLAIPPAAIWTPKFNGPWLTGGDSIFLFIGTLPGTGGLSFTYTVPPLPPGFESVEFIAQGVRVAPGSGTLLADPYRGILIDGSF